MKKKKIGIIGAGWFGCYIGYDLVKSGYEVTIFEKKNQIFQGASGYNQNRLHQGFHYPRSYKTINESKNGYKNFIKKFPRFVKNIHKNLYVVADDKNNKLDFKIYKQILKSNNLPFKEEINLYKLKNYSGIISCKEKLIDTSLAKKFFIRNLFKNIKKKKIIKSIIEKNNKIKINNIEFDKVVNCTWQTAFATKKLKFTYEACLFFLYKCKKKNHPAITIMDGPFTTLYPQEARYFTLYSVKYTRLKQFTNFENCEKYLKKIKKNNIILRSRKQHENQIKNFYPDFHKNFEYKKPLITYRTIVNNANAERSSKIFIDGNIINLLSGKIDHVIQCSKEIKKCLKKF